MLICQFLWIVVPLFQRNDLSSLISSRTIPNIEAKANTVQAMFTNWIMQKLTQFSQQSLFWNLSITSSRNSAQMIHYIPPRRPQSSPATLKFDLSISIFDMSTGPHIHTMQYREQIMIPWTVIKQYSAVELNVGFYSLTAYIII